MFAPVVCALVTAQAAPPSSLQSVANLKAFLEAAPLADEHRALLAKNQFVVAPADMSEIHYVYAENDYANVPSIVTTDTILHLFHLTFDATLRTAEQKALYPRAVALTKKMIAALQRDTRDAKSPAQMLARRRAIAYFGVADRLFGQSTPLPADVRPMVAQELQLIKDKRGYEPSAVVPSKIDFTQFIVRGHYTKSQTLSRYFLGMMWFGLAPIEVRDSRGNPVEAGARIAVTIADAMSASSLVADWQGIYEPTTLYAGTVNSLTPAMVSAVRRKMPGRPDSLNWKSFGDALAKLDPAIYKPSIQLQAGVAQGTIVKFMGQRGLLDGWVISRVTSLERPLPTGLDVMAALGSKTAAGILDTNAEAFNPKGWVDYGRRLSDATAKLASLKPSEWATNLYVGWLDVLRSKVAPPPHAIPPFMKSGAWGAASLEGGLASWAQLRHDTILYGEQTAIEMGDGEEEQPYVRGYVEPNLPFYDKLTRLLSMLRAGLVERKLIAKDALLDLDHLRALTTFLRGCVEKEVAGKPLAKADHMRIRKIEGEIEEITTDLLMQGLNYNTLTQDDRDMALVADIHSADPLAFTVACGHADDLIAIVPIEGKLYLARGPVFSYYEFPVQMTERLTDEKWKAMLRDGKAPERPFWTSQYRSAKPARAPIE